MAKVRVYEIAKELNMDPRAVLRKLADLGEFVRSASSTLEAPVVKKLREAMAPGNRNTLPTTAQSDPRSAAALIFGVDERTLKLKPRPRSNSSVSKAKPINPWAYEMFTPAQRDAWKAAGFVDSDVHLAKRCIELGITPEDLAVRIGASSVRSHLQSRWYTPRQIAVLLGKPRVP